MPQCSAALAAILTVVLATGGCSGGSVDDPAGTSSSLPGRSSGGDVAGSGTIVQVGDRVWVASPDDRSVAAVDPSTLDTVERVDLDGTPDRLLPIGKQVLVSFRDRSYLSLVTPGAGARLAARIDLPCAAGAAMASWWSDDRRYVAVACPIDGRVAIVDMYARAVRGWLTDVRPGEVAVHGGSLVAAATNGSLTTWELDEVDGASVAAPPSGPVGEVAVEGERSRVWSPKDRRVSQVKALVSTPAGPAAAYQVIDSERAADPTRPGDTGSYASVIEGMARIEPAVGAWCPNLMSDFSDVRRSLSGAAALAVDAAHGRLWVVGEFTGNVMVLDCAAPAVDVDGVSRASVLASFDVGVGARGIVLSEDGSTAWVDSAFDHAVARIDLDPSASPSSGTVERKVRDVGAIALSDEAQQGRRQFHDATDVHLTPNRVVTCASCHTGAGDDGVAWRISTADIPRKYRRTPPLWALSRAGNSAGSLHWDAGFDELDDLTIDTVRQLLGGDGLLVDSAAIGSYLAETPVPLGAWIAGDDPAAAALVDDGRALFEGPAGCAGCHAGEQGSDGLAHDVVEESGDPDGVLGLVRTPRLVGLAGRSGFLHDGRASGLSDLLTANADDRHGVTSGLTDEQRAALVAYLRTR